ECFVGGGSTFFAMPTTVRRWINDLNRPLMAVYTALRDRPEKFIELCRGYVSDDPDTMRRNFVALLHDDLADEAVRYFVLNRCAFNGRVRLDHPWRHRTFFSNCSGMNIINGGRLPVAAELMRNTVITS